MESEYWFIYLNDSMLIAMKQFVSFKSSASSMDSIAEFSKGLSLGLLFLIYINDIHASSWILSFIFYAYDIFYHKNLNGGSVVVNKQLLQVRYLLGFILIDYLWNSKRLIIFIFTWNINTKTDDQLICMLC